MVYIVHSVLKGIVNLEFTDALSFESKSLSFSAMHHEFIVTEIERKKEGKKHLFDTMH